MKIIKKDEFWYAHQKWKQDKKANENEFADKIFKKALDSVNKNFSKSTYFSKEDVEEREDIAQAVFESIWKICDKLENFNGGYINKTVINRVYKLHRDKKKSPKKPPSSTEEERAFKRTLQENAWSETIELLEKELLILNKNNKEETEKHINYATDRFLKKLSQKEIAMKYNLTLTQVKDLFREKKKIKIALKNINSAFINNKLLID